MFRQYHFRDYRLSLIVWVTALSVIGIMVIGSAQHGLQLRQIFGLVIGVAMMLTLSMIDYTWLFGFNWLYYFGGLLLLGAVLVVGENVNGATRWIRIGIQFQPSDLMKIILVLFFAEYLARNEDKISSPRILIPAVLLIGMPLFLIYKEPDLSTSIAIALTFCVILFIGGLSWKIIAALLAVVVPSGIIFFSVILQPGQTLIKEYQLTRILAWLRPSEYPQDAYQQTNSIIAIGSGQLYGKGLANNMINSVKNGNFIAEPQTDFVFAVAGEELGFLGCCLIVLLELLIALECIRIGRRARDFAGTLFACGIGSMILIQSFMNICVATGLMPNTGIPLPFVSYGLTSLISFCMGIGIVLNIGLQTRKY